MKPIQLDFSRCPTLAYARDYTLDLIRRMEQALAPLAQVNSGVTSAIASGSIGRLEAMGHSDCDLMVIVDEDTAADPARARAAMDVVWTALEPLGIPLPKSSGIYSVPASQAQICDHSTLGLVADDKNVFGKRLQFLLDARPVFGRQAYEDLIDGLLQRYAAGFLEYDPRKEWVTLLNDILRYFRSYCVWHQYDLSFDPIDSWFVRNAKLRNSRLLMFAALILLLGECSKERKDKIGWMRERLHLTPLERLQYVFDANGDGGMQRILPAYDRFLELLRSDAVREALIQTHPQTLKERHQTHLPAYEEMKDCSRVLMRELTRCVLDRRDDWSERFFEYLLF